MGRHSVPGTAVRKGQADAFDLLSLSWSTSREPKGGTLDSLSLMCRVDSSTPLILALVQSNDSVDAGLTSLRSTGQDDVEVVRMSLGGARVTSLQFSGSEDEGQTESLPLEYRSLSLGVTRMSPEGVPLDTVQYGYDCNDPTHAADLVRAASVKVSSSMPQDYGIDRTREGAEYPNRREV